MNPPAVPHALRLPAPRRVHKTGVSVNAPWGWRALVLSLLLFIPISIGFVGRIAVTILGHPVRAIVDSHTRQTGSKGHVTRTLHYHFPIEGGSQRNRQSVTISTYAVPDGGTIAVRWIHFLGMDLDSVTQSVGDYLETLVMMAFFFLLSTGWLWIAVYGVFFETPRRRALVSDGVATLGTIQTKWLNSKRGERPRLTYAYADPVCAKQLTRTDPVTAACYNSCEVGQQLVVVYDPNAPERAMLYDMCGYAVDE